MEIKKLDEEILDGDIYQSESGIYFIYEVLPGFKEGIMRSITKEQAYLYAGKKEEAK